VQEAIETALWRLTGERITIRYAGRTDAGVHAEGQVVAFETGRALDERSVLAGLNANLPPTIVAWEAKPVEPGYDPRRRAVSRVYRYQIEQRPWPSPFLRRYSWHVREPLDIAAMHRAAQALVGEHDFAAFAHRSGVAVGSTVRRVRSIAVRRVADLVLVEIEADAYLPHMVRNIVGTLVWVGRGRLDGPAITRILASRDRRRAGPAAPGHGLFLVRVRYPDDPPEVGEKE
jgi:tRNA pseudouridine38-40 synthase